MSRARMLIALLLALALIAIAGILYTITRSADAPAQSTEDTRPGSSQNVPPSSNGSVTQDGEETSDTTPSSSGTGANNYMSQDAGGEGIQ
ncbi:MAG TPA: hypothetical protein VK978_04960 [Candidatus Saccharimonadales bacterium]|nr:hypothetical protein [Candidatus Saccharimonadales bacterium]